MLSNDWITHNGQGAPDLPPGTRVQVRFRDDEDPWMNEYGSDIQGVPFDQVRKYSLWTVGTYEGPDDIVAYRVVPDAQ